MEKFKQEAETVRASYMTQDEASAVMNLWSERQQEQSARGSLVTIHDVAEATQLGAPDIERLLQEVRLSSRVAVERRLQA